MRNTARPEPDAPVAVVLGGTGWVGRHLCTAFARRGHRVLAVARNPVRPAAGHGFRSLDLAQAPAAALRRLLSEVRADVVVNATDAANATDGWDRSEAELHTANVRLVERLIEAMADLEGRPRLVHIGTIHEYGPAEPGTALDESVPPRPANTYARTKLAGSRAVLAAARAGTVDGTVLRLVNVCGPLPSPASFPGKLVALLREAVAGGTPRLRIAEARRDWLDVRDAAAAAVPAAELPVSGHAFNLGSGIAVPTRELVELCCAVAGLPGSALAEQRDGAVPSLGGSWIQADTGLARELLEWRPRFSLRDSLRDMWHAELGREA